MHERYRSTAASSTRCGLHRLDCNCPLLASNIRRVGARLWPPARALSCHLSGSYLWASPAIALYDTFAHDPRLSNDVRTAAANASRAVGDLGLAHKKSHGFAPFSGTDYRDAVGPTVHFATNHGQLDPWAPKVSQTHTAFYEEVGAGKLDRALLA
jgi:hypothetical protein